MVEGKGWRPFMPQKQREELESFENRLNDQFLGSCPQYFDRDGDPISIADWVEAFGDEDYKRVAEDQVDDWWISTVWLGLNHSFSLNPEAPPVIFETMVFDNSDEGLKESEAVGERVGMPSIGALGPDAYQNRYHTEEAALKGHKETVLAAEAGLIRREE